MRASAAVGIAVLLLGLASLPGWAAGDRKLECEQGGDPDLAIKACTDIIENPSRFHDAFSTDAVYSAYSNRGLAYAHKGLASQALADYAKALQGKPSKVTYHNRASIYLKQKDWSNALRDVEAGLALPQPKDASVFAVIDKTYDAYLDYDKGAAMTGLGRDREALSAFQDAYRESHGDDSLHASAEDAIKKLGGVVPSQFGTLAPTTLPPSTSLLPSLPPSTNTNPLGAYTLSPNPPLYIDKPKPIPSTDQLWKEFDNRDRNAPARPMTKEEEDSLNGILGTLKAICRSQPQLAACK